MGIWEFDNLNLKELRRVSSLIDELESLGLSSNPDMVLELEAELNKQEEYHHKRMTYRDLLGHLQVMDKEQLDSDATIYDEEDDEYRPIRDIDFATEDTQILDPNHPFLEIK